MSAAARSRVDLESALRRQFDEAVGAQRTMNLEKFKLVTACRSTFFAERLFQAIDVDGSGDITFDEFVDAIHVLQTRDSKRRIHFIFKLFDTDGDGFIQFKELREVLRASVEESDASLPDEEIEDLAAKLKDIFVGKRVQGGSEDPDSISLEEFESVLEQYPDVLEGLSLEGVTVGRPRTGSNKRKKPNKIKSAITWMGMNPQLTFTYTITMIAILGCWAWRFGR